LVKRSVEEWALSAEWSVWVPVQTWGGAGRGEESAELVGETAAEGVVVVEKEGEGMGGTSKVEEEDEWLRDGVGEGDGVSAGVVLSTAIWLSWAWMKMEASAALAR
jgi:hypothetical protein